MKIIRKSVAALERLSVKTLVIVLMALVAVGLILMLVTSGIFS